MTAPEPAYVAAPFAPRDGFRPFENTLRALLIGQLARREGLAPLVVHPGVYLGLFGDDANLADRAFGLQASLALVQAVRNRPGGELWVLTNQDGGTSEGVRLELEAWRRYRKGGVRIGRWDAWQQLAVRHRLGRVHTILSQPGPYSAADAAALFTFAPLEPR